MERLLLCLGEKRVNLDEDRVRWLESKDDNLDSSDFFPRKIIWNSCV